MRVSTNAVERWPAAEHSIAQPGSNCWRKAAAQRAAVLVDGEAFFNAFTEAAQRAQHSILIAGWDFNTAVRLQPGACGDADTDRIGNFLDRLVRRRRSLSIYVLDWDFSFIYALQRQLLPRFRFARGLHRRFHFRLDNRHPMAGAQHQKIAVIDDAVAFVGGFDFAACRWDTPAHAPQDERRVDPWGKPYPPYHDVAMAVDGARGRGARRPLSPSLARAPPANVCGRRRLGSTHGLRASSPTSATSTWRSRVPCRRSRGRRRSARSKRFSSMRSRRRNTRSTSRTNISPPG